MNHSSSPPLKVILVFLLLCLPVQILHAETYSYDVTGRLTSVLFDDGSSIAYTYDNNGNRTNTTLIGADVDNDGMDNTVDTDDDGDGVLDVDDAFPFDAAEWLDTDGDGTGNNADTDDDGDGVPDVDDAFPLDATESVDTDADGVGDNSDNCLTVPNSNQLDGNSNGIGDACEAEEDDFVNILIMIIKQQAGQN